MYRLLIEHTVTVPCDSFSRAIALWNECCFELKSCGNWRTQVHLQKFIPNKNKWRTIRK